MVTTPTGTALKHAIGFSDGEEVLHPSDAHTPLLEGHQQQ